MRRNDLSCATLALGLLALASGCRTTLWQTADSVDGEKPSMWPNTRYASAEEHLPEAAPEPEKTAELSFASGRWMESVGNLIEARRNYEDVLEEHPTHVDALLGLARIDQLAGRTHEAEQRFLTAMRHEPNSSIVLHSLGKFYESEQRWPEAADAYNRAMLAAPTENRYRQDLAVALVHTGDVNAARTHFVRTVGDAAAHYNIGLILHEIGRTDSAEQQMLLAVTKQPDMQQAQYWLDEIRREREASWAMQENLERAGEAGGSALRLADHERPAVSSPPGQSGHSLNVNSVTPIQALSPQQMQQLQNQR